MKESRRETVDTYNRSAAELAEYFKGIGPRAEDIELAFKLAGDPPNARVLEIGCGDGRDADEVVKRAGSYLGIDISEEFIKIARQKVPQAEFEVADVTTFEFPENLDIIFAFASLLHLDKDEVEGVLARANQALRPGGIFDISLKYMPEYAERLQEDKFGLRQFYYYSPQLITHLGGDGYALKRTWVVDKQGGEWTEIFLQKK
jgi:SAM-dependent methyltransferase